MGNKNNQKAATKREFRKEKMKEQLARLERLQPKDSVSLPDITTYGELVRKYRGEAHLTIEQLAEEVGMTRQSMLDIEKGRRAKIDVELMYMIAISLGCSIDNLTGKTEIRGGILGINSEEELEAGVKGASATPEIRELYEALKQLHYMHPDLAKRIIILARAGEYPTIQKANDLLDVGLREFFYNLKYYTHDI